jgi:hypothetical protein
MIAAVGSAAGERYRLDGRHRRARGSRRHLSGQAVDWEDLAVHFEKWG